MDQAHTKNLDEGQPFLPSEGFDLEEDPVIAAKSKPSHHYRIWLAGALFLLSVTFVVSGVSNRPSEARCIRVLNYWSPMLEAIQYRPQKAELLEQSKYMGTPTAELEQAWDDLWKWGSLGIQEDKLPLLNKSSTERDWHHLPKEMGGGVQAFFEGYHHLHCLDLIRKYTYRHEWDYSYVHAFVNVDVDIVEHVEHCLEMLRAKLMCESDTTPYLVLDDRDHGKVVSLGTQRSCRDHGSIVEWSVNNINVPFVGARDA